MNPPCELRLHFPLKKCPNPIDRLASFREDARVEMPNVRQPRPDLDFDFASRRLEVIGHAHGVVAQDFVAADLDKDRW